MKREVKKTQKTVVDYYFSELKGMAANTAKDVWDMIEQAKSLKDMCYRNAKKGNVDLLKYFVQLGEFILKCYESLPEERKSDAERTSIEQALAILWSKPNKE